MSIKGQKKRAFNFRLGLFGRSPHQTHFSDIRPFFFALVPVNCVSNSALSLKGCFLYGVTQNRFFYRCFKRLTRRSQYKNRRATSHVQWVTKVMGHDPCFHEKYMESGVMTFVAHCTVYMRLSPAGVLKYP